VASKESASHTESIESISASLSGRFPTLHARPSGFYRGAVGSRRPKAHEARLPKVMVLHDGRAIAFLTRLDGPAIRPFVAVFNGEAVFACLSASPGKPKTDDGQRNQ
jgi:hypothetical protein